MCLMALQTFRDVLVSLVACRTEKLPMFARLVNHFFALLWVTRKTWVSEIWSQLHFERGVRVGMAGLAAADLIVRLPGVAHAAHGDNVLFGHHGGMSLMTVHTGHR